MNSADAGSIPKSIEPGSRIGVFGGGQLGRMFARVAQRLGYHVTVFSPEVGGPAHQVVSESIYANYDDLDAVGRFAKSVDVITLEFENIQLQAVEEAMRWCPVRPGAHVLSMAQHRIREKTLLSELGFPVTPFRRVNEHSDLQGLETITGWPCILKTAAFGYDGKGQRKVANESEARLFLDEVRCEVVAEKIVDFSCEVSALVARNPSGEVVVFPLFFNRHANHILDLTLCPVPSEFQSITKQAESMAFEVAQSLQLEGLLCIEFFVDQDHRLMINEVAPRPHNSGHLTIEGCQTCQFEQQLRAICNLPLGSVGLLHPQMGMANLLGDVWQRGIPNFKLAMEDPSAALHLYGKDHAKPGRKMGHVTIWGDSAHAVEKSLRDLRSNLSGTAR